MCAKSQLINKLKKYKYKSIKNCPSCSRNVLSKSELEFSSSRNLTYFLTALKKQPERKKEIFLLSYKSRHS